MLGTVYSLSESEPLSLACYQLVEDNFDVDRITEALSRIDFPAELFPFIHHVAILHVSLKIATGNRQEERVKLLVQLLHNEARPHV